MLAPEGSFGAVCAQRQQSLQRVQVETAQRPGMRAQAQIIFFQDVVRAPAEGCKCDHGSQGQPD